MKKLNQSKKIIIIISLLAVLLVAGILAYFTDTQTVHNTLSIGTVDIEVKEYTLNGGVEENWAPKENISPNEKISKIVRINAKSGTLDCYVRAKINLECNDATLNNSNDMPSVSDLNINISSDWKLKSDGYYYYDKVVTPTTPIQLFSEFTIPSNLNNDWSGKQFDLSVKVDAIQANNFELKISDEKPWGDITEAQIKSAN